MTQENTAATTEDTAAQAATQDTSSDKTMAIVSYALMLASPLLSGLPALVGIIMAYVMKGSASELTQTHYRGMIRIFWAYVLLTVVVLGAYLLFFGMMMQGSGFGGTLVVGVVASIVGLWLYVLLIIGLVKLAKDKPYR